MMVLDYIVCAIRDLTLEQLKYTAPENYVPVEMLEVDELEQKQDHYVYTFEHGDRKLKLILPLELEPDFNFITHRDEFLKLNQMPTGLPFGDKKLYLTKEKFNELLL